MITGLVAWATDVLEDPTAGANALRLQMPLLVNEPRPPEFAIRNQNRDSWVARVELPDEQLERGPLLLIRQANEFESQFLADDRPRPATMDLAIIAAMKKSNSAEGLRDCLNMLRCAHRALLLPFQQAAGASPVVTYGSIELEPAEGGTTWLPPAGPESLLLGGFVVAFRVTDPWALGF